MGISFVLFISIEKKNNGKEGKTTIPLDCSVKSSKMGLETTIQENFFPVKFQVWWIFPV